MTETSFETVLEHIFSSSDNTKQQGDAFENATLFFLKNDPLWQQHFDGVWLWNDAPTKTGQDIGIDLVARDAMDGSYWAIQCKCFQEDSSLSYKQLSTFFSTAASDSRYKHFMIVDTANAWTSNLHKIADKYHTVRIDAAALRESELDWEPFLEGRPAAERTFHEPMEHQRVAIDKTIEKFKTADRGKLIMACGTGKTLTVLRLAEEYCPKGVVLFLAPSISLVSQTLRSWANQAKGRLMPFVVCSDVKASKLEDVWETSVSEIPFPSTTDATLLSEQVKKAGKDGLTVVFSTYQSIQVIIDAQKKGLPQFDLCICDEAHRTTGVRNLGESKEDQSAFTKVHDEKSLHARKRLYMTATPRIYGTNAVKKAHEENYEVSSMDDISKYGEEFYRLSFGRAVEKGLLSDYRVLVLTVSEEMASQVYQQAMQEDEGGFDVPEAAKILGCWKGLATRGEQIGDLSLYRADLEKGEFQEQGLDVDEFIPMQRAVAFSSTIAESKRFADLFQQVVDTYIEKTGTEFPLTVETQHVDGSMDSVTRKGKLHWLEEQPGLDICRVLTNAKCLSEGIDVPDLDAVLFMKPRKSQVDIIQAVGRVMRKAPGKKYGYIILPVVVPAGMTPEEALDDDKAFAVVWQILQALRSHDERLDARINSLKFIGEGNPEGEVIKVDPFDPQEEQQKTAVQEKLALEWTIKDWQDAMEVTLVKKCGTRVYWEDWADDVAGIANRHIKRIRAILDSDEHARKVFDGFLTGLRDSLNPGISESQAIEMLAQHLITLPVFEALFGDESFAKSNPVSMAMEGMLDVLREHAIEDREDDAVLQTLYDSVRSRISVVQSAAGRQGIIKELYEGFFSKAFKSTSEKMGIVYTPNEIVDYILHATDRMLKQEFGEGLGSPGVHILDPFAGTGTFMADLIASDIISDEELPKKYLEELHSNEILLLAYYIMTINIEQAYHARMSGEYVPFKGAVLTDTFQMTEEGDTLDTEVFTQNSERVVAQNELPIKVIVGNPPYSAGQKSTNDNNANESYPSLDSRIAQTYAAQTDATNKNALYDSYIRAIRWASDRVGEKGLICYVSNAGWIDGQAMDGMRKSLAEEFSSIYVFHLRGNARTQGVERQKEKDNVFGQGTRTPIAITLLVKSLKQEEKCKIFFQDIGDYLTREEKLAIVKHAATSEEAKWTRLTPDRHGDWLNQRDDSFTEFPPLLMGKRTQPLGMVTNWSNGVQTNRDVWVTGFNKKTIQQTANSLVNFYNSLVRESKDRTLEQDGVCNDPKLISWTRKLRKKFEKGEVLSETIPQPRLTQYRPFCKQYLILSNELNEYVNQAFAFFPEAHSRNVIMMVGGASALVTNSMPNVEVIHNGQCFGLNWYEKQENYKGLLSGVSEGNLVRHDAITDEALSVFREAYPCPFGSRGKIAARAKKDGGPELNKEDIFYYIYGVLHSPEYRGRFSSNLKKQLPRIPLAEDFAAFSCAGRALAALHLNYETVAPWPLEEVGDSSNPGRTEKIRFGKCSKDENHPKGEDQTVLSVAENLTLKGIPLQAYDYMVNGKSAIGWLMDRYKVTTDKASGIVNDPNEYSDDPRYIVDLVKRVVRVSMETIELIGSLPALNEREQPTDWPFAWKASE